MEAIEKDRANYELLRQAVQKGVPAPPFFGSALTFRVSIYEKCANQIGQLGKDEAENLVWFHGFVDGIRDDAPRLYRDSDWPAREPRMKSFNHLLDEYLPAGMLRAKTLQRKLEAAARREWRLWML
jgi:hypothetical protein